MRELLVVLVLLFMKFFVFSLRRAPVLRSAAGALSLQRRGAAALQSDHTPTPSFLLQPPTLEQQLIIDAVTSGDCNVQVNAVAGSGKTTTLLHVASELQNRGKSMLALLYSRRLKDETRSKASALSISNTAVESFHAFGVKHYRFDAKTDVGLQKIVDSDCRPRTPFSFDLVAIDKIQDMNSLYADLVFKILRDNQRGKNVTLLVLGDDKQNIFQFKDADSRHLTLCQEVFKNVNDRPWRKLQLETSFRLSGNMGTFLNKNVLGYPLFKTTKAPGSKVQYFRGNPFKVVDKVADELLKLLKSGKIEPADVFIIAPSIRLGKADKETPVNRLSNLLLRAGYHYYAPISEEQVVSDDAAKNKIVVSTFHQTKGLERKVVVVFDFNLPYFFFYGKILPKDVCPNILYVACTRATERLFLIGEATKGEMLPFLKDIKSCQHLDVTLVESRGFERDNKLEMKNVTKAAVTRLCKYLPEQVRKRALASIRTTQLVAPHQTVHLASRVTTAPGQVEEVYELTGVALPAMYEYRNTKAPTTINTEAAEILESREQVSAKGRGPADKQDNATVQAFLRELDEGCGPANNISSYLRMSAIYSYAVSGFLNKAIQIKEFDWITPEQADKCIDVLALHLKSKGKSMVHYEHGLKHVTRFPLPEPPSSSSSSYSSFFSEATGARIELSGRIDAITPDGTVWELKCVEALEDDHILQLACYAWLVMQDGGRVLFGKKGSSGLKISAFKLLNMRTGELLQLTSSEEELQACMSVLVERLLAGEPEISDDDFIKNLSFPRAVSVAAKPSAATATKTKAKAKPEAKAKAKAIAMDTLVSAMVRAKGRPARKEPKAPVLVSMSPPSFD